VTGLRRTSGGLFGALTAVAGLAGCVSGAATSARERKVNCEIEGAERLPPESGGSAAVCAPIAAALAAGLPDRRLVVRVRILRKDMIEATVSLPDGRPVAGLDLAISDARLCERHFRQFAEELAAVVAQELHPRGS
jgi:hypothetical protein